MITQLLPTDLGAALVVNQKQDVKQVKNLGWLLRHWSDVSYFEVSPYVGANKSIDCILKAHLKGGGYYATGFADKSVLWDWLKRPVFYSVRLLWFGHQASVERGKDQPPC